MNIAQKVKIVDDYRDNGIVFFKEGMFWKCYNAHAMYFVLNVKPMKISTRWYKNLNQYVHSLGFPDGALSRYINDIKTKYNPQNIKVESNIVRIINLQWLEVMFYHDWEKDYVEAFKRKVTEEKLLKERENTAQMLISKCLNEELQYMVDAITEFDVNNGTPVQAFSLIMKLQDRLKL